MAKAEYRSAIRSRKLINEALADLLQEKPLEKITVTDVVTRANINRGTFYAHYKDIPDVVDHLIQQTFSAITDVLSAQKPLSPNLGSSILTQIQSILEEDMFFYRKILCSGAASLMQDRLVEIVCDYLLQNREAFYHGGREEYELGIRFCAGGLSNLYRDWFEGKLPMTLDELTQRADEIISGIIRNMERSSDCGE